MLSKSEHVKRVLATNFDLPAADVQERLARKGVEIEVGLVHVVRSAMRKERALEEQRQAAEAARLKAEKDAEAAKKQRERDALQAKMKAMAAKAQQTKKLNPQPLREHILRALAEKPGATIPEIITRSRLTYKLLSNTPEEEEAFKQSVRKKLRLLVTAGEVTQVQVVGADDLFNIKGVAAVAVPAHTADVGVKREEVTGGIAALVNQLKQIVSKLGKDQTKELVDVL